MKCGPIYKKLSPLCVGRHEKYEGTMSGYEITFKTEAGTFITKSLDFGVRGLNVPVIVTLTDEGVEVEVKK